MSSLTALASSTSRDAYAYDTFTTGLIVDDLAFDRARAASAAAASATVASRSSASG
jgi:hypothetical protein